MSKITTGQAVGIFLFVFLLLIVVVLLAVGFHAKKNSGRVLVRQGRGPSIIAE